MRLALPRSGPPPPAWQPARSLPAVLFLAGLSLALGLGQFLPQPPPPPEKLPLLELRCWRLRAGGAEERREVLDLGPGDGLRFQVPVPQDGWLQAYRVAGGRVSTWLEPVRVRAGEVYEDERSVPLEPGGQELWFLLSREPLDPEVVASALLEPTAREGRPPGIVAWLRRLVVSPALPSVQGAPSSR